METNKLLAACWSIDQYQFGFTLWNNTVW